MRSNFFDQTGQDKSDRGAMAHAEFKNCPQLSYINIYAKRLNGSEARVLLGVTV